MTTYAYDAADRCIETRYVDGTGITHSYDRSGLLIRQEMVEADRVDRRLTRFGYDGRGLVVTADNGDAAVAFERDEIGRVTAETVNGHRIESTYDCCGNRTSRRVGDALTTYTYDPLARIIPCAVAGVA